MAKPNEPSPERVNAVQDLAQWTLDQVCQEAKRRGLRPTEAGCALSWAAASMACRVWLGPGGSGMDEMLHVWMATMLKAAQGHARDQKE